MIRSNSLYLPLFLTTLIVLLAACGGDADTNTPPEVNKASTSITARVDDSFNVTYEYVLNASVNDPDGQIESVNWQLLSNQSITLQNSNTDSVSFSHSIESSEEQNLLILEVSATDDDGATDFDIVEIDLNDVIEVFVESKTARKGEPVVVNAIIRGRASRLHSLQWHVPALEANGFSQIDWDSIQFVTPNQAHINTLDVLLDITYTNGAEARVVGRVDLE